MSADAKRISIQFIDDEIEMMMFEDVKVFNDAASVSIVDCDLEYIIPKSNVKQFKILR